MTETPSGHSYTAVALVELSRLVGAWLPFTGLERRSISRPEMDVRGIPLPEGVSEPATRVTHSRILTGPFSSDTHKPNYCLLMLAWTQAMGTSLRAIRLPSALLEARGGKFTCSVQIAPKILPLLYRNSRRLGEAPSHGRVLVQSNPSRSIYVFAIAHADLERARFPSCGDRVLKEEHLGQHNDDYWHGFFWASDSCRGSRCHLSAMDSVCITHRPGALCQGSPRYCGAAKKFGAHSQRGALVRPAGRVPADEPGPQMTGRFCCIITDGTALSKANKRSHPDFL